MGLTCERTLLLSRWLLCVKTQYRRRRLRDVLELDVRSPNQLRLVLVTELSRRGRPNHCTVINFEPRL